MLGQKRNMVKTVVERLLASLMIITLISGMLPATAFAAPGNDDHVNIVDAATAVHAAATSQLQADVDRAQALVNALPSDTQKDWLQGILNDVQNSIDTTAANSMIAQINALPPIDTLVLTDKPAVQDARAGYNALTADQKALVTNLAKLAAAEARIAELKVEADKAAALAIDNRIAALPAVAMLTLGDKDGVAAARAAYTALTSEQKDLVTKLADLVAAETRIAKLEADATAALAVDNKIAALPVVDALTLGDKDGVAAARTAYTALTADQTALVTKLAKLEAAEVRIAELKAEADAAAALAVDNRIAALPAVAMLTLGDKADVVAARAAYAALSSEQKDLVTKLAVLAAAETRIAKLEADAAAALAVDNRIAALPAVDALTLGDKAAVIAARAAYTALTADRKALVAKLAKLEAAEARIAELKVEADKAAALAVDNKIAALPAVAMLTLGDEAAVLAARAAYYALTIEQKALLTKLAVLNAAEARIAKLKADANAALAVDNRIAALPAVDELTLAYRYDVGTARARYTELTADQKALVTKLAVLVAAEARIAELVALAVDNQIAALPGVDELTLADMDGVAAARAAYTALTANQKALVTKLAVLVAAEARIVELKADAAAALVVDIKIASLTAVGALQLGERNSVLAARAAYLALTDEQKSLVTKLAKLEAAEARMDELVADAAAASAVDNLIAALPNPFYYYNPPYVTLSDKDRVYAAYAAYTALTADQKALVTNLAKLEAAKAIIDDMAAGEAAALAVDNMIAALPAIDEQTLADKDAVYAAVDALVALTYNQQRLVTRATILIIMDAKMHYMENNAIRAQPVVDMIAALPPMEEITLFNGQAVQAVYAARDAYEMLNSDSKPYVTNLAVLEVAVTRLDELWAEDFAAAVVRNMIGNLPYADELWMYPNVTADAQAARAAYEALPDSTKQYVFNLAELEACEVEIAAALAVDNMIAALPTVDELTLADKDAVYAVSDAFSALIYEQQQLVVRVWDLLELGIKLQMLEVAQPVVDMIAALPPVDEITLFNEQAVLAVYAARDAYEMLNSDLKPYVTNHAVLEAAVARLDELWAEDFAADVVRNMIGNLPYADELWMYPNAEADVQAARAAYEALPDSTKQYVFNLADLEACEAEIARQNLYSAQISAFYDVYYFFEYGYLNYSQENYMILYDLKNAGGDAIANAGTLAEVIEARDAALAAMRDVKTIAEENPEAYPEAFATAKAAAHADLDYTFTSFDPNNYSPENWIVLTTAKADGDAAIEAAGSIVDVNIAKTTANNAMYAVQPLY